MQATATWTDERVEALKALLASGCSAREAAFHIGGVTRNAVIGKAKRLGVALRQRHFVDAEEKRARRREYVRQYRASHTTKTNAGNLVMRLRKVRPRIPDFMATEVADSPPDQSPCAVTFAQLDAQHCRYPLGDPADPTTFRYCGEARLNERPYCARHCRVAYRPVQEREIAKCR